MSTAAVYAILRLGVHAVYLSGIFTPAGYEQYTIPIDLQLYVDASRAILAQQNLYLTATRIEVYQYPPAFALVFTPFLLLSPAALVAVHTLLHIGAYLVMYVSWDRIFAHLQLERGRAVLVATLPVWLVFASFWSDLGFLNTYILLALLATLAIKSIVKEHLAQSVLWLAIIVQIKPHWAFPLLLPLLLGQTRFFLRLTAATALVSGAVVIVTSLIVGPAYGLQQHLDYVRFLWDMRRDFPWRGPEEAFLGYSHSITQIVTYLFGVSSGTLRAALALKTLLLVPIGIAALVHLLRPADHPSKQVPWLALDWAFALYAAVFVWLDMVWEFSLGIAAFTYLLATAERRTVQVLTWIVFVPYALLDFWRLFSLALFGMDVIAPGMYVLTDPSIYVPIIMVVVLFCYAVLLTRLWRVRGAIRPLHHGQPSVT